MSWAAAAIIELQKGNPATVTPHGNSMTPRVKSGQTVTVKPSTEYSKGDVVLVRCKGRVYLHLVLTRDRNRYLIGNNHGGTNGWVAAGAIYGKADI